MKLRLWQSECARTAIEHFKKVSKHFLCLATPGAGKTVMSAEVAARLIEQDLIDFILCFSPSVSVASGFKATFSKRLNHRFDGLIGALGCSYTYQSMSHFDPSFWQVLTSNRVLVIFDEIHHCAGLTVENSNTWGEEIIRNIQSQAKYTLALTGTPWRSDKSPIVLSEYIGEENTIKCGYSYGLKQSVADKVCRKPNIVLIDNEEITVTDHLNETKVFNSFQALIDEKAASYQEIITDKKAVEFILGKGCRKLAEIRQRKPNAGGLVVASSVAHAAQIIRILQTTFNQSAVIVSYQQDAPAEIIDSYRNSTIQWIVAIGMVSEGTDIPRLQVCCHLSRIKTELYFRQVLGRILRVDNANYQTAWLYTFSEPNLVKYAFRIEEDLPNHSVIIRESFNYDTDYIENNPELASELSASRNVLPKISFKEETENIHPICYNDEIPVFTSHSTQRSFEILGMFREQVVATFNSPFQ
jgi:superfamily II DNA or RNA helicase